MRPCFLAVLLVGSACAPAPRPPAPPTAEPARTDATPPPQAAATEATSVTGAPLRRPILPDALYAARYDDWQAATARVAASPDELDAHVWLGRRAAYLGRYRESIDIYTDALERFDSEPHLLRHRGHRYITLRNFEAAIADLEAAAEAARGMPSEVEPDGLPNAAGIPTGTLQSNIFYHLGLAYFLVGRFDEALAAYRTCLQVATTDDTRVATTHWLYVTLRRLGKHDEAKAALAPFHADLALHENFSYLRLLLLYRGEVKPEDAIPDDAGELDRSTIGFGVGHWRSVEGDQPGARMAWRDASATEQWASFGYIAAAVELTRNPNR